MNNKKTLGSPDSPDLSFLNEMLDNDMDAIKMLLEIYLEDAPVMVAELEEHLKNRDHEQLKRVSHTLITEFSTVGVTSIVNDLKRINKSSTEMADLENTVARVREALDKSVEYFKSIF